MRRRCEGEVQGHPNAECGVRNEGRSSKRWQRHWHSSVQAPKKHQAPNSKLQGRKTSNIKGEVQGPRSFECGVRSEELSVVSCQCVRRIRMRWIQESARKRQRAARTPRRCRDSSTPSISARRGISNFKRSKCRRRLSACSF